MRMKIVSIAFARDEDFEDTFRLGENRVGRPMKFEFRVIFYGGFQNRQSHCAILAEVFLIPHFSEEGCPV